MSQDPSEVRDGHLIRPTQDAPSSDAPPPTPATRGFPRRLLFAAAAGMAVGVPMGWLLAHAAMLPFYLGLFFFALFGLLIGAVEFRIARPLAPIARPPLLVAGLLTVLWTWLATMGFEYHNLTADVHTFVWNSFRTLDAEAKRQIGAVPVRIRDHLRTSYPPGGMIGYMRWAARSGRITVGTLPNGRPIEFRLHQGPLGWSLRVAVCAGLLAFGVMSQVLSLGEPAEQPGEEEEHTSGSPQRSPFG